MFIRAQTGSNEKFLICSDPFRDHPDLRRILQIMGSKVSLRKDFPTTGYNEVRYDEVQKKVVYEPVSLTQEYRQFDFMSPGRARNT